MNKSKIEWCDHTWNPVTGCLHNCRYCYAKSMTTRFSGNVRRNKMAMDSYRQLNQDGRKLYVLENPMVNETGHNLVYPFGFEPTLHKYRLDYPEKLKMGNNIFVGAMADIFGEWVPDEWITEIFDVCAQHPIHNYLFLTKNPKRYWNLEEKGLLPCGENIWYGFSYTDNNCQSWSSMQGDKNSFVSVEPLLEDLMMFDEAVLCPAAKWVIVGAETGKHRDKVIPDKAWIDKIVRHCDRFKIPVFMKDSLIPIVGEENMRREFPKALQRHEISEKMENRLYDVCCTCGAYLKKGEMVTLSARSRRRECAKNFCYMCTDCFEEFCKEKGIEIPKLAYQEEER